MFTKKLSRQLKKAFGPDLEQKIPVWLTALETTNGFAAAEDIKEFFRAFPQFIGQVDRAYLESSNRMEHTFHALELSSDELTKANATLFGLNQTVGAMLNSLGQGFLLFGRDGICLPIYSKACEQLFNGSPAHKSILDILRVPEDQRATMRDWYEILFSDRFDFNDIADLGIQFLPPLANEVIRLEYKAIREQKKAITHIMVIATDRTSEVIAQLKNEELQSHARFLTSALKNRSRFDKFVLETRRTFQSCRELLENPSFALSDVVLLERDLHTLKGLSTVYSLVELHRNLHDLEHALKGHPSAASFKSHVRPKLDFAINSFEQFLRNNRDVLGENPERSVQYREVRLENLREIASHLKGTPKFELFINKTISTPIFDLFEQFNASILAASEHTNKKVSPIQFSGENISLIPEHYASVINALVHIFTNAVSHGIEMPHVRRRLGKPEAGQVFVNVSRHGTNRFVIKIRDDGGGVDLDKIREKLKQKGRMSEALHSTSKELINFLFENDFSTASEINRLSGRGVGLDAVRAVVNSVGGSILIESEIRVGTCFLIELPLITDFPDEQFSRAG